MTDAVRLAANSYTSQGDRRDRVFLPAELFDGTVNQSVVHQSVKAFLANQRQGTHSTKTRGLVTGGNQKPWRQKGTGRARQGSTRAPHWPGGGTVFGPLPRGYTQDVPKKVRLLARKSAFNARARERAIFVIEELKNDVPKTKNIRELLNKLAIGARKVLILTDGPKRNVYLSGRNLPNVMVLPFDEAATYHLMWSHAVLVESKALGGQLEAAPPAEDEPETEAAPARSEKRKSAPRGKKAAPARKSRGGGASSSKSGKSGAKRAKPAAKASGKGAAKSTKTKPAAKRAKSGSRKKEK